MYFHCKNVHFIIVFLLFDNDFHEGVSLDYVNFFC